MNEIRKRAYKTLNFQALLDIKNCGEFSEKNFNQTFHIAHAFHTLAEYIILDFERFDERNFWDRINFLEKQFGMYHFRKIFNDLVEIEK